MRDRGIRRAAATFVMVLAVSGANRAEERPVPYAETPDDPPAAIVPREDARARALAPPIRLGPYASIQVNVDSLGRDIVGDAANEPSLAVHPTNRSNLVVGWRQFDSVASNFRQAGWAYTFDGGLSWTFPGVLEPGVFRSDPVLAVDSAGTFYYQSLRSSFLLDVYRSFDGGVTWSAPVPSFGGDKNWMAIDRSGGIGEGNVYGTWQRFAACCGANILTRSTDGGASYETPLPCAFSPFFGTMAVGPDGELYLSGADGTSGQDLDQFVVARSADARDPGLTPTTTGRVVELAGSMVIGSGPNPVGLLGQANVAVDRTTGPGRGNVYLLSTVAPRVALGPGDPADVYLTRSRDGGETWSEPTRVNDDVSFANWQWLAALDVAPDGRLDVVWFDTRALGLQDFAQLYYAYSYDEGVTWSRNLAVSPIFETSIGRPQQAKIGDYISIVSDATGGSVAYPATYRFGQDVYFVRVFPDCNGNGRSDFADLAADTSFDCDADRVPDECQAAPACIGAGRVPDGSGIAGAPLRIGRADGGRILLEWGPSCAAGDTDYAVYEGSVGAFTSHVPRVCGTDGDTFAEIVPAAESSYYLVVPTNADREGSLGTDGAGAERPPSASACRPRFVRPCGGGS